eukprot:CAMPEP_0202905578 /NCGR_PEP_ID=MMETSP1392-20130828/34974_1 /ASSEMBLY_ACC=CAM_ASM_000868 /TAXON_ID=225041 /ORGANISM="Chlamydomonas chlamydogama, Strain SAG 11-48b" /LENGTH=66 /DNA_ID=CAMNT_0049593731 /DNA_START=45 /DNA_END=242 /DNA_ORIENTATION=-
MKILNMNKILPRYSRSNTMLRLSKAYLCLLLACDMMLQSAMAQPERSMSTPNATGMSQFALQGPGL